MAAPLPTRCCVSLMPAQPASATATATLKAAIVFVFMEMLLEIVGFRYRLQG